MCSHDQLSSPDHPSSAEQRPRSDSYAEMCHIMLMVTILRCMAERTMHERQQGTIVNTEVDSFSVKLKLDEIIERFPPALLANPVPIANENDLRQSDLRERKSPDALAKRRILDLDNEVIVADSAEFGLGVAIRRDEVDYLLDSLRSGSDEPYRKKVHAVLSNPLLSTNLN